VKVIVKVSRDAKGNTLHMEIDICPCGIVDTSKNLTFSCLDLDTRFTTTLSDEGRQKFKAIILEFCKMHASEGII
jgi:hypothetical protein